MPRTVRQAINKAIKDCDCSRLAKFRLRIAMRLNPDVREMVEQECCEYLQEEKALDGFLTQGVQTAIDIDQWERILQLLIEYLPQLISIFVNLFSSNPALMQKQLEAEGIDLTDCGDDCNPPKVQNRKTVNRNKKKK